VISKLNFTDNTKIIELLDSAVKSIFGLLNDVCLANANDNDFLDKVHNQWVNNHENFPPSNYTTTKKAFIIKHTPCEIEY
jgi:myosin heavy subunit